MYLFLKNNFTEFLQKAIDIVAACRQIITVFFINCSSPDSDDTFGGDEPDEDFSGRDDQFLVSDRTENKFYGNRRLN